MSEPGSDMIPQILRRLERLERSLRLWKRLSLGASLALAVVLLTRQVPPKVLAQQAPVPPPPADQEKDPDHVALAKRRLNLSRSGLDIVRQSARQGALMSNQRDYLYRWSYRLLGDQIYLTMEDGDPRVPDPEVYLAVSDAKPSRERTLAFQAHRDRLLEWEQQMRPLYEKGILSPIDFMDIQSYRLEAELWLARERQKEAQAVREFGPEPKAKPDAPSESR
jgi:hypothetical protein